MTEPNDQPEVRVMVPHLPIAPWITEALTKMQSDYTEALRKAHSDDGWRHEVEVYAEAGQTQPAWADSEALGLCPMVCPDHQRHCDPGDGGHPGRHACSLCAHWAPRHPGRPLVVVIGEDRRGHD